MTCAETSEIIFLRHLPEQATAQLAPEATKRCASDLNYLDAVAKNQCEDSKAALLTRCQHRPPACLDLGGLQVAGRKPHLNSPNCCCGIQRESLTRLFRPEAKISGLLLLPLQPATKNHGSTASNPLNSAQVAQNDTHQLPRHRNCQLECLN